MFTQRRRRERNLYDAYPSCQTLSTSARAVRVKGTVGQARLPGEKLHSSKYRTHILKYVPHPHTQVRTTPTYSSAYHTHILKCVPHPHTQVYHTHILKYVPHPHTQVRTTPTYSSAYHTHILKYVPHPHTQVRTTPTYSSAYHTHILKYVPLPHVSCLQSGFTKVLQCTSTGHSNLE